MINKAAYMSGTHKIIYKDIPVPEIAPHEVLIEMDVVGICGSDSHYFDHGNIGDFVVEGDFVLGHEGAGYVAAIGSDVKSLKVGDRVALEPGVVCGTCEFCLSGKYNLCESVEFFATPPYHGVFANYVKHPENLCFKLPDNVSNLEGALVEPLAVGLHASGHGEVKLGDTVVVFGSGCIGLVSMMASKARGASKVIIVDVIEKRLEFAKKMGADYIINAKNENVIDTINKLTDNNGAHVVIETAGAEITVKQTVSVVKRGGVIVLVGMTVKPETSFDFMKLQGKEATVKTIFRYRNLYPVAINAISSGTINVKEIATHEFDFDQLQEAFDYVAANPETVVKAVVKIKK